MMPIAVSAGETLDDKRDPPPDKIRTKLALQNKRGRAYGVSDYGKVVQYTSIAVAFNGVWHDMIYSARIIVILRPIRSPASMCA